MTCSSVFFLPVLFTFAWCCAGSLQVPDAGVGKELILGQKIDVFLLQAWESVSSRLLSDYRLLNVCQNSNELDTTTTPSYMMAIQLDSLYLGQAQIYRLFVYTS